MRSARERPKGEGAAPPGFWDHDPRPQSFRLRQFAGVVSEDTIVRTEAEEPVSAEALHAIESLISQIDWR